MQAEEVRLLRVGKAEWLISAEAEGTALELLTEVPNLRIHPLTEPLPAAPADEYAEARQADIEQAQERMAVDDGDGLPSGYYDANTDGELELTDQPVEPFTGWHGTSVAPDDAPDGVLDLELRKPVSDGREHLKQYDSLYTTPSPLTAEYHAHQSKRRQAKEGRTDKQPQIYELAVSPSEVVELGRCDDPKPVHEAYTRGADVILCPNWTARGVPQPRKSLSLTTTSMTLCGSWRLSRCRPKQLRMSKGREREPLPGTARQSVRIPVVPPSVLQHPNGIGNAGPAIGSIRIFGKGKGAAAHRRDWLPALPGPKSAVLN